MDRFLSWDPLSHVPHMLMCYLLWEDLLEIHAPVLAYATELSLITKLR